jgi:hypothetical protein
MQLKFTFTMQANYSDYFGGSNFEGLGGKIEGNYHSISER